MFRFLVLGLLRDGAVHHGYALMKDYAARAGNHVNGGSFYRELARLVAEGLAEFAEAEPDADERRRPYRITDAGREMFDEWMLSAPADIGEYEDELSGRAVFLQWSAPERARGMFDRWRDLLWLRGKMVESARERASLSRLADGEGRFQPLPILLARQLKHIAADIEYLDELRGTYEAWVVGLARGAARPLPATGSAASGDRRRPSRPKAQRSASLAVTRRRKQS